MAKLKKYKDNDVVKVRFNYAAYISDEENPFDVEKIYNEPTLAKGDIKLQLMLETKNVIHAGQIVELYWHMAKKYVKAKTPCFFHKRGLGVSYPEDPNWIREHRLAEIVA